MLADMPNDEHAAPVVAHVNAAIASLLVPIASVRLDPKNSRRHPRRNLDAIKQSLSAHKQQKPIIVDSEGVIRAGNGTLQAAVELGWTHIAALRYDGKDVRAYAISDNRSADLAHWDYENLISELRDLEEDGWDLDDLGWDEYELASIGGKPWNPGDSDDTIPPHIEGRCKPGQLWSLGEHRLLCADSRLTENCAKLLAGAQIGLAITSPPYAEQREYGGAPTDAYVAWFAPIQEFIAQALADEGSWVLNIKEHCDDNQRVIYVKQLVLAHVLEWDWKFIEEYIWIHGGTPRSAKRRLKNGFEPIFHFVRKDYKFYPERVMKQGVALAPDRFRFGREGHASNEDRQGRRTPGRRRRKASSEEQGSPEVDHAFDFEATEATFPSNVISVGKNREALGHPAAYPVALAQFFTRLLTDEGEIVFDPFCGSGSTLIAADVENRVARCMDLSPKYCDIVLARWESRTNKKAELLSE